VKGWKFAPAMLGGKPVAGTARINVVFNPFNPGNVDIPNKPLPTPESAGGEGNGGFRCADVKAAKYAVYPPNTVASGTVVLDVKVGADGSVEGVRLLRGAGILWGAATRALKEWEFVPAKYQGKAVESHEVVVYVFVSPAVGTM
jgi:TonB family protein